MIVLVIILVLLLAFTGYLLYINYRRANRAVEYCEAYVRFISALYFQFKDTRDTMKEIDARGSFQADDETGTVFKELDVQVETLYEFIRKYVNTEQAEEDEKTKD